MVPLSMGGAVGIALVAGLGFFDWRLSEVVLRVFLYLFYGVVV
jgi:hypothetical protein